MTDHLMHPVSSLTHLFCTLVLRRVEQVDGDVMMSTYVRSESSPSVSWKVGSFQAFVEAKVRLICRERIV